MKITAFSLALALVATAPLAGCGDDGGGPGDQDPDASPPVARTLQGPCDLAERLGEFRVAVDPDYSTISGSVSDGVIPVTVLEEVMTVGDCKLMRRQNPFCDPLCQADETCDLDGQCVRAPVKQDIGVVTIQGLVESVVLEPLQPTNDYFATSLPHPVFEPGTLIGLTSTDGRYGELDLIGYGVDALVTDAGPWTVAAAQDLTVTWQAPSGETDGRVLLTVNIDQHGNTPVTLRCDVPDTGEIVVASAVIDALLDFGVTGFPSGTLTRRTVDSQDVSDGCVELVVASPLLRNIDVSGHTPCNRDEDCPDGQLCNIPIQTCE